MQHAIHLATDFKKTGYEQSYSVCVDKYESLLGEMGLSESEIEQRINETLSATRNNESAVELVERLLGPISESD